jgi:hypothetical protein
MSDLSLQFTASDYFCEHRLDKKSLLNGDILARNKVAECYDCRALLACGGEGGEEGVVQRGEGSGQPATTPPQRAEVGIRNDPLRP